MEPWRIFMTNRIYKICARDAWQTASANGAYHGSADDIRDGFIHFSTHSQLAGTAAKHFAGAPGLILLEIAVDRLGDALKWEPAQDGALFPHLYAPLTTDAVTRQWDLPLGEDGDHLFPPELA